MYIQLNSQVIFYDKKGDHGPAVLLLHGNGGSHEMYDVLAEDLSCDYTVYLMDTRGHGASATPKEFHYSQMAEDVLALCHALSLSDTILVGYSDGAIMALMAVLKEESLFKKLVLCGANLSPAGLSHSLLHQIKKEYKKTGDPLKNLMLQEPHIEPDSLPSISIPVLVVAGEKDCIRKKETLSIARHIPRSTLHIVQGEDHGSYLTHTAMAASFLRPFFLEQ